MIFIDLVFLDTVNHSEQAIQSPSLRGHATSHILQQADELWIPHITSIHILPP